MTALQRLIGKLAPQAEKAALPPPAEHVAAAVDLQKTMGRDRVTGLPHRACFAHVLMLQGQIAARLETRLSLVVLEWEGYNTPGQDNETRDRRLNLLAAALRARLHRTHDVLGSLGDGRLAAMLPFTDGAGADTVARNLQHAGLKALCGAASAAPRATPGIAEKMPAVAEDHEPTGDGDERPLNEADAEEVAADLSGETINVGISAYNGKGQLADDAILKAAERAVAYAALNGGDRIVRFDPGSEMLR